MPQLCHCAVRTYRAAPGRRDAVTPIQELTEVDSPVEGAGSRTVPLAASGSATATQKATSAGSAGSAGCRSHLTSSEVMQLCQMSCNVMQHEATSCNFRTEKGGTG